MRLQLLLSSALLHLVAANEFGSHSHCCEALRKAGLGQSLISSTNVFAFQTSLAKYFSLSARLSPQCFFQPRDSTEVSEGIKALVRANQTQSCQFAVRGGGHMHWAGAAGIEKGVTIDMGKINHVAYHEQNSSVSVGAGAVWGEVYSYLDKINIMVTGARSSSVGVAGSTLGGGNSYHAGSRGLICDGVLQYEIVLGDGSIVTASKDERADLFRALKGGSSNMGLVTRFDYQAYEGGKMFGGVIKHSLDTADQQFASLHKFANAINFDPYSSIIVISNYFSIMKDGFFSDVLDYAKPAKRSEIPIMRDFLAIKNKLGDSTGLRNMTSLAHEFEVPKDSRVSFSTLTFKNDVRVMRKAHEAFLQVVSKLKAEAKGSWGILTLYQPIPTIFAKHGNENGGNVLGLDRFKDTLILYEPYLKWEGSDQDELFNGQSHYLREVVSTYARSIGADNEWLYLNYADRDQSPLEGYGAENVARIRAASRKYDPEGVFQYMMPGGFKVSRVRAPCKQYDLR
ncbi:Bifunctional solanapyrone synthase [Lecanosticta acicola]|uniref:Bifunctional solanapyrone synthase n=1 Tax=Lecanosticta acicola TaxID=111012 RepID=A0AAI9E8W2_9PEZI|nr:Bifunctional solanapyrone synthase [Lecanosticta acicola]